MFERILIGFDFSACGGQALAVARQNFPAARRRLMFVADAEPKAPSALDLLGEGSGVYGEMERGRVRLDVLRELDETVVSVVGRPAEALLEEAQRWGADLIVLGTHGRRGLDHLFFGSVAEQVVRRAQVPVLTVREVVERAKTSAPKATSESDVHGMTPAPGLAEGSAG